MTSGLPWPPDPSVPRDALDLAAATWRVCAGAQHVRWDVPLRRKVETICCVLVGDIVPGGGGDWREGGGEDGEKAARVLLRGRLAASFL